MYDIFIVDTNPNGLEHGIPAHATRTRFFGSYLETIRRCVNKATTEYIWVISNVCDYYNFDFNYRPSSWEAKQIHCWASDDLRFGDTFLIPVDEFKKQEPLEKLEWFKDVHYHYPGVSRQYLKWTYTSDIFKTIKEINDPYTVIDTYCYSFGGFMEVTPPTPNLWEKRHIYPLNKSGSVVAVPYECKHIIKEQLYDYPYISYEYADNMVDYPLDIVFISNGEKNADINYNRLMVGSYDRSFIGDRIHRVDGVNGRTAAYQAAAKLSSTPWFFAVFAKCEVTNFDWEWQPDYMQQPKHYIFHAKNPVNGLEYGHMGVIAYNVDLVLNPPNPIGLDFTLSAPHAVVPEVSCIARYDMDEYSTWRTAFRETLKLRNQYDTNNTIENEYRLHCWKTKGEGEFGEWSIRGAQDAVAFYNDVQGNPKKLQKSYEWEWLKTKFESYQNSQ